MKCVKIRLRSHGFQIFSKGIMSNGHSDRFMNGGKRFACWEFEPTLHGFVKVRVFPVCS